MKKLLTTIIVLTLGLVAIAQPSDPSAYLDDASRVVPPSPDAAALGKYGQYPVDMHTGIPKINIPLYQVQSKQLSLDVGLNYHASGFRVDEIASWVGLGWTLNCGGVITRTMQGRPDDGLYGYLSQTVKYSADIDPDNDWDYMEDIAENIKENESDLYFINVAGMTGKFIFDKNKEILLIPESTFKVDASDFPNGFSITLDNGTIYKFNSREQTVTGSASVDNFDYTSAWYLTTILSADQTDSIEFVYKTDAPYSNYSWSYIEGIGPKHYEDGNGVVQLENPKHDFLVSNWYQRVYAKRLDSVKFTNGLITFTTTTDRKDLPDSRITQMEVRKLDYATQTYVLHRSVTFLNDDYFAYNNGSTVVPSDYKQHRLKLNGIIEKDAVGTNIREHKFYYNENTLLPPKEDKAQDHWGFYNGKSSNSTFIPGDTYAIGGQTYNNIGGADRDPDPNYTDANILTKIHFPTGGYTEFVYENHKYDEPTVDPVTKIADAHDNGNTTELLTDEVTFSPSRTGWATLIAECSDVGGESNPYFSRVILTDENTGQNLINHVYDPAVYGPLIPDHTKTYQVYLHQSKTYRLEAKAQGESYSTRWGLAAYAKGILTYEEETPGTISTAGGLRISEIKTYEKPGATPIVETYKYGFNESGAGTLMLDRDLLSNYKLGKTYRFSDSDPIVGITYYYSDRMFFYGSTVNQLSTLNGSPVLYAEVTKYIGTPTINQGKTIYGFDIAKADIIASLEYYKNGRMVVNSDWKGGQQVMEQHFESGASSPIRTQLSDYHLFSDVEDTGIKVGYKVIHEGPFKAQTYTEFQDLFYHFEYPIYSGYKRRTTVTNIENPQASSADSLLTIQEFFYDNPEHQQVTKTITTDSEGQEIEQRTTYPQDYQSSLENFSTLEQKNIISVPVKTEQVIDGKLVNATVTKYNDDGKPKEVYRYESATLNNVADLDTTTLGLTSDYQKKVTLKYDTSSKNLVGLDKEDDIESSFAWGYDHSRPVVRADNVSQTNLNTAISNAISATPGSYSDLEDLLEGVGNMSQTSQRDTWKSFNTSLRNHANLSASLVTTYTYDPLLGMTSVTDPSGLTGYYEYDNMGRLQDRDDLESELTTSYDYYYKGPPNISASTDNLSFTGAGENKIVTLDANTDWTASDDRSWLSVSPTSGLEGANVTITASQNSSSTPRTGTVTISDANSTGLPDQEIAITQAGFNPSLTVSTNEIYYTGPDTKSFSITSNVSWSISIYYYNGYGWVNYLPISGSGNATINVTVSYVSKFEPYFAELTVTGGGISRYVDILYY